MFLRDNATLKVQIKSSGDSYINSGGNFGIGTDSPGTNLEVVGNTITNEVTASNIMLRDNGKIGSDHTQTLIKLNNDDSWSINANSSDTALLISNAGVRVNNQNNASLNFQADGTYDGLFLVDAGDDFVQVSGSLRVTGPNGHITASGNISASGQVFSNTYYQWEATARCDTDDDSNWQGPNSKGLMSNEDWNFDYGTDYDGTSDNAESRLYMNTGWWIPHGANYSASIKSMDIYVQPNSNITHADDDFFSCSLWYSKASDLAPELNVIDATAGTFVQRHGASVNSDQFKATDEKFFKYNNCHVSQSINLDLAPGSMLFPRIKTGGTNNFNTNVYWVVHYCKKPL